MTFEIKPAEDRPVRSPDPVDAEAINFTASPATLTVTRGVGESAHVATLSTPIVPAPACLFVDTFTGAQAAAQTHTPDIAPAGFAYAQIGTGPNTTLQLNGTGRLVGVEIGYGTAGVVDSSASSPVLQNLVPTIPYTLEVTMRPTAALANGVVLVQFKDATNPFNTNLYVSITRSVTGVYTLEVGAENYTGPLMDGYAFLTLVLASDAERNIKVYVTGTTFSVSIDGSAGLPPNSVGTENLPTAFNAVRYLVDTNSPFSADNSYIDRVSLCNGAT